MGRNSYQLTKHQIHQLSDYVEEVGQLLEELSLDDEATHFINETIEDSHFQLRYIVEELLKREDE